MGKNINTQQILQIGKKNNNYIWDAKYFEKRSNESHTYLFQHLEIKKFLQKFLKNYGLSLYRYKISFLESTLKIFVSYFKTSKIKNIISKFNTDQKLRLVKKTKCLKKSLWNDFIYKKTRKNNFKSNKQLKKRTFRNFFKFYKTYIKHHLFVKTATRKNFRSFFSKYKATKFFETQKFFLTMNYFFLQKYIQDWQHLKKMKLSRFFKYKLKKIYNTYLIKKSLPTLVSDIKLKKTLFVNDQNYLKFFLNNSYSKKLSNIFLLNKNLYKKRVRSLRYYKHYSKLQNKKILNNKKIDNFLNKYNEILNIFTKNSCKNSLILHQINQNMTFNLTYGQLQSLKKLTTQLRQFKNAAFFKEGLNVMISSIINPSSTNLLVNFISTQLRLIKRHGFFFKFLIKTLSLLLKHKFSKVKSIKILIKGRINGKPRAKHKNIFINKDMSLMTINSSINYNQSTAFNPKGTFGVKLWVHKN